MNERDGFDIALVVLVGLALARESLASRSGRVTTIEALVGAVTELDPVYYLIVGGVFGVFFLSYITIYLPQKQNS
ncbi:hypothetical protein SAMN05216226_11057 [Halovenus aranensis]|jgi:hypothetical protein|uniref:Uncharacterized protein n=1 Tax=Halovenus aranensis TaxID=890420 RepID=A0A1G8X161_9EURY|nr:hypothetical protein [Halovenus aranensis]SDJ84352.1 hypothetical protein SAMN05216226_11057 [Halovenus aranensis]